MKTRQHTRNLIIAALGIAAGVTAPGANAQTKTAPPDPPRPRFLPTEDTAYMPLSYRRDTSGYRAALEALTWVGAVPYRKGGANLKTGIDDAQFVAAVFDNVGVKCPAPPTENMAASGELVHWKEAKEMVVAGRSVFLPAPPPLAWLLPGDRLIFRYGTEKGAPGYLTTGVYVGRYRNLTHAFVHASAKMGTVVVEELTQGRHWETYQYALRPFRYGGPSLVSLDNAQPAKSAGNERVPAVLDVSGGRFLAVAAAVGKYGQDAISASGASADADRFAAALVGMASAQGAKFDRDHSFILKADDKGETSGDGRPTRQKILDSLRTAARKTTAGDTLVFYFAGNGVNAETGPLAEAAQGGSVLLPADFDPTRGPSTVITLAEIAEIVRNAPATRALLVLDTSFVRMPAAAMRGLSDSGKQVVILSASAPNEKCYTDSLPGGGRGGVFTQYVIRGLAGAADMNEDRLVSLEELQTYVHKHVTEDTQSMQTPSLATTPPSLGGIIARRPSSASGTRSVANEGPR